MTDNAEQIAPEVETEEEPSSWHEEAGIAGDPKFEKFESPADLAKSYAELESKIGSTIRFPTKEAGDEDIAKFNNMMAERGYHRAPDIDDEDGIRQIQSMVGLPAEPDGYQFGEVEGYEGDPESEGAFKAVAHEAGLTAKQANAIHQWLGSNIAETTQAQEKQAQEMMQSLKGEWGQAFDLKMSQAKNAAHMLEERVPGISTYFDQMAESGQDANMIRLMNAFAEATGEKGINVPPAGEAALTPAEAQQRIEDAQQNPNHWWHKDPDQLTSRQQDQRVEWLKAAYGG